MSASDHLGQQFMSVSDIGQLGSSNGDYTVEGWRQNVSVGTHARASNQGKPVEVMHGHPRGSLLWDGHHRYADAVEAGTGQLPVKHTDWSEWTRKNYKSAP